MNKILNLEQAIKIAKKLRKQNKLIVLAGGCFDIIHAGHVIFLDKAKTCGHVLFILLESDKTIRRLKGDKRPINKQKERALVLSAIKAVDFVVMLTNFKTDRQYDEIITKIHPSIIATTVNDPFVFHKKRQAKLINARVVYVSKRVFDQSSTRTAALSKREIL